jgi:phosphomevalonate kinase
LGLGSSAAATVALTKMILAHNHSADRNLLWKLSLESHRDFSGGIGSGADVAASVYGETIKYMLLKAGPKITAIRPNAFLKDLIVIATPRAQDTRDRVRKVMAIDGRILDDFIATSRKHCLDVESARTEQEFIHAVDGLVFCLTALSAHAKFSFASEEQIAISRLAHSLGGTAKPSGAGGGDVSIAYVPHDKRDRFIDLVGAISGCFALQ